MNRTIECKFPDQNPRESRFIVVLYSKRERERGWLTWSVSAVAHSSAVLTGVGLYSSDSDRTAHSLKTLSTLSAPEPIRWDVVLDHYHTLKVLHHFEEGDYQKFCGERHSARIWTLCIVKQSWESRAARSWKSPEDDTRLSWSTRSSPGKLVITSRNSLFTRFAPL